MTQHFFIGVDGGATKTQVRVEDAQGNLLGQEVGGPASLRLSPEQAWQSIIAALAKILLPNTLNLRDPHCRFHAGMGLAGTEVEAALQAYLQHPHTFASLQVTSDAHVACLGAHGGGDGALIVIGTGTVGYQIENRQHTKVGGWGFPHGDEGSGAWLGLQAFQHSLQCWDGRQPKSLLAQALKDYFGSNQQRVVAWASAANSTAYAALAPIILEQYAKGDDMAKHLLQSAGAHIDNIAVALIQAQRQTKTLLPCSLVGGIANFVQPFLGKSLQSRLAPCQQTPEQGAILMIRNALA